MFDLIAEKEKHPQNLSISTLFSLLISFGAFSALRPYTDCVCEWDCWTASCVEYKWIYEWNMAPREGGLQFLRTSPGIIWYCDIPWLILLFHKSVHTSKSTIVIIRLFYKPAVPAVKKEVLPWMTSTSSGTSFVMRSCQQPPQILPPRPPLFFPLTWTAPLNKVTGKTEAQFNCELSV